MVRNDDLKFFITEGEGWENRLYKYFKRKLASFGCPDSFIEPTALKMTKDTIAIIMGEK